MAAPTKEKQINIAFFKLKPTDSGKQRWNVKDQDEVWYSVWDAPVATQIQDAQGNNYAVTIHYTEKGDFKNIQSVTPAGAQLTEQDILDEFRTEEPKPNPGPAKTGAPATPPKPSAVSEVALMVKEREFAFHMATLAFAGGKIERKALPDYADFALRYVRGENPLNTKITQPAKEATDELDPDNFVQ